MRWNRFINARKGSKSQESESAGLVRLRNAFLISVWALGAGAGCLSWWYGGAAEQWYVEMMIGLVAAIGSGAAGSLVGLILRAGWSRLRRDKTGRNEDTVNGSMLGAFIGGFIGLISSLVAATPEAVPFGVALGVGIGACIGTAGSETAGVLMRMLLRDSGKGGTYTPPVRLDEWEDYEDDQDGPI